MALLPRRSFSICSFYHAEYLNRFSGFSCKCLTCLRLWKSRMLRCCRLARLGLTSYPSMPALSFPVYWRQWQWVLALCLCSYASLNIQYCPSPASWQLLVFCCWAVLLSLLQCFCLLPLSRKATRWRRDEEFYTTQVACSCGLAWPIWPSCQPERTFFLHLETESFFPTTSLTTKPLTAWYRRSGMALFTTACISPLSTKLTTARTHGHVSCIGAAVCWRVSWWRWSGHWPGRVREHWRCRCGWTWCFFYFPSGCSSGTWLSPEVICQQTSEYT